jgi:hypothetical protein
MCAQMTLHDSGNFWGNEADEYCVHFHKARQSWLDATSDWPPFLLINPGLGRHKSRRKKAND